MVKPRPSEVMPSILPFWTIKLWIRTGSKRNMIGRRTLVYRNLMTWPFNTTPLYNNRVKTALVTGANRGLGLGFVGQFLDRGFQVFAGVIEPEKFYPELKSHSNLVIVKLDVSDDGSIKSAFEEVSKHTDHLDYLINNAGLNKDTATNNQKELVSTLKNLDRGLLMKMFDVNAIGPLMVLKQFSALIKNNPAFVVNISSFRASHHDENPNALGDYGYRASKAALTMITLCSLHDLPGNVKTFSVNPGGMKTEMNPKGELDPTTQAGKIIEITENWEDGLNGKLLNYDGEPYPL